MINAAAIFLFAKIDAIFITNNNFANCGLIFIA